MGWVSAQGGQLHGVSPPSLGEPTETAAVGRGVLAALAPLASAQPLPAFPNRFLSHSFSVALSHLKSRSSRRELLQSPTHSPASPVQTSVPHQRLHREPSTLLGLVRRSRYGVRMTPLTPRHPRVPVRGRRPGLRDTAVAQEQRRGIAPASPFAGLWAGVKALLCLEAEPVSAPVPAAPELLINGRQLGERPKK